jgi:WD40 repeat protein
MRAIFISHSSRDAAWAERLASWLREQGHQSLFLDFDPQSGIPAGRDWDRELHHQLRRCRAVIALVSEHFVASEWCKGEVWIASNLGKSLFPVKVGACDLPQMLGRLQAIDLTTDPDSGLRRLARGLVAAGLDPGTSFSWDGSRPPYPGLMAFQEADAAVFFGRDRELQEALDRLHNLRRFGGKALLVLLGASGCGKSSLVRAGIVPRLRRDRQTWLVLDPFRPGADPMGELAEALASAFQAAGGTAPASPATLASLKSQLEALRRCSGQREASVVVVIDQFEELLSSNASPAGTVAGAPAQDGHPTPAERFLAELRDVVGEGDGDGRVLVIATLRSDALGTFQAHPAIAGIAFEDLTLGPMKMSAYAQVIAGPAEVAGVGLEPALVERMVADTSRGDALPLLAFSLRELWERHGGNGDLTLLAYERLGGLAGSVQRAADGLLAAWPLSPDEQEALRQAFLQMCRINEEGQLGRIVARWEAMPLASRATLRRFVEARLLISGKHTGTIEVAHEALLRTWPVLNHWLQASRDFVLWRGRVQGALAEYERSGTVLGGRPLQEAERWRLETAADSPERRLIQASLGARNRRRRRTGLLAGSAGLALVAFTAVIWRQLQDIRQWQTEVFVETHRRTLVANPLESVVNGLAALARSVNSDPGKRLMLSATLPRAIDNNLTVGRTPISTGQGRVWSLVELRNGELVSGGDDGSLRRWRNDKPVGGPLLTGQGRVLSLIELTTGEWISGGSDGTLRRWRDGEAVGPPIQSGQGMVWSLAELNTGELISGGEDGSLRRWRDGAPVGAPIATNHGGVYSLVVLGSGELISGGEDGRLRRWRNGAPLGAPIATNQGGVYSLAVLSSGELISGGEDGMRRWRNGQPVGPPIQTGQGRVLGLAELPSGELLSGGDSGSLRRWRAGTPVGEAISTGQEQVSRLLQLRNGELVSAGHNGSLRRWRAGRQPGERIPTGQGGVQSLLQLRNGDVISGGDDGSLRRWRAGQPLGAAIQTGQGMVRTIVQLGDGELISGGDNGTLRRWRDDAALGEPIQTGQGSVHSLVDLGHGELISGGRTGSLRRWRGGRPVGAPIQTGQGIVWSLVALRNGLLISGGADGTLRRWRAGQPLGEGIQTGQGSVLSLIELGNGELVSGGEDGSLRRWRSGNPVGDEIETGQGSVVSLIELGNGELVSGGEDGSLRRWRNGKPLGDRIETGLALVWAVISLGNGELVSGGHDGTLVWLSANRVIQNACRHELPELMQVPEKLSDKEASSLCRRMGALNPAPAAP